MPYLLPQPCIQRRDTGRKKGVVVIVAGAVNQPFCIATQKEEKNANVGRNCGYADPYQKR